MRKIEMRVNMHNNYVFTNPIYLSIFMQIYLCTVKNKQSQVEDGLVTLKTKSVLSLGLKA